MSGYTYLAENIEQGTYYAIKELEPRPCKPDIYREICIRFGTEADYLSRLGGFNGQIPKFYESFKANDSEDTEREYIVQEYIAGRTLTQYMEAQGRPMGESQVKEVLVRLLPVVSYIHQVGFIHRDIKPGNIILRTADGVPVLIDYGAVKEYEITLILRVSGQTAFVGTPGYYDEDQLNGAPTVTSDLYALGAVAVYLLTNTPPRDIRHKDGKMLWGDHVLGLSKDFFHVIDKAVEPRASYPGQRFGSAQAMLDALNQVASNAELEDELTQLATRQCRPTTTRNFVQCRECGWRIDSEERNCANCGAFNVHCFTEDEVYLFNNSPGKYLAYVRDTFPTRDEKGVAPLLHLKKKDYNLISNLVDTYIMKHTDFLPRLPGYLAWDGSGELQSIPDKRPFGVTLGEFLEAHRNAVGHVGVAAWVLMGIVGSIPGSVMVLKELKISLCFTPFAVVAVVWVCLCVRSWVWDCLDGSIGYLLADKRDVAGQLASLRKLTKIDKDNLQRGLHKSATSSKDDLVKQFESYSAAYRESGFYLKRDEASINKQLEAIGTSKARLSKAADRLDGVIRDTPSDIPNEDQKRDRERTSVALQYLSQQDLKYRAKLQEIELLRLNNVLQAETPRRQATERNRDETMKKIGQMAKLSDTIYTDLKKTNVAGAGSERLWLERMTLVREALVKLNNSLASHMVDLAHKSRDEQPADFPPEVTSGLDRIAVYLTNKDFDKEYQMLQAKYGKP